MPKKRQYSEESLRKAISDVKEKLLTAGRASKTYNIPKSTLLLKLKGKKCKRYGNETVLSADLEKQLASWVILCAASGCPKTTKGILDAAKDLASLGGKKFRGGTPTYGWLNGFMKRHPNISKRTPEALGKSSALITHDRLKGYFDFLYSQFEKAGMLEVLNRPSSWWNVDESNFVMNPVPKKVYAEKGAKVVYNVERGKPKENITCTYAVAADGNFIPPLITFKDTFNDLVSAATTSGSIGANFGFNQTASGWMKGDAFFHFVTQHLNPRWIEMNIERPIVLVVDGYSGHHSVKLYRWCLENDVILTVLYPNSTHILQVLDVAVFGPLKAKYTEKFQKWKTNNPEKSFNEIEFIKVLKQTNDEVINKQTIINGWRSTGLQPFNFDNIKTNRLLLNAGNSQIAKTPQEQTDPIDYSFDNNLLPLNDETPSFEMAELTAPDESSLSYHDDITDVPVSILRNDEFQAEPNNNNDTIQSMVKNDTIEESIDLSVYEFNHSAEFTSLSSDSKTKQLVARARDAVNDLRIHLKESEPSKLLNVLIMEQQLNIIEPVVIIPAVPSTSVQTPADILKTPATTTHKQPRQRKGLKVSYGVMSDLQIITEIENRDLEEQKIAEEHKKDEEAKQERNMQLKAMKAKLLAETENLKATRNQLKSLEAEAAEERKKVATKRKKIASSKKSKQLIPPDSEPQEKRRKTK